MKKRFNCKYCGVATGYIDNNNPFLEEAWEEEHAQCKDFLYVYKINVRKNKEVEHEKIN
ncbi:hypothetical protein M0R04_15135 [Candidatus Dojkabacteria bacterium]|jgi:hypothetical protein|nr:hypothetical protein [Candidatus Dojkabacteria bacterium]